MLVLQRLIKISVKSIVAAVGFAVQENYFMKWLEQKMWSIWSLKISCDMRCSWGWLKVIEIDYYHCRV